MNNVRTALAMAACIAAGSAVSAGDAPATQQSDALAAKWSRTDSDVTPLGHVAFHGPFCNESVSVSWTSLPAHDFVRVECDLLILRTWDGSVLYVNGRRTSDGPDNFRISVPGGATLVATTFSNHPDDPGFNDNGKHQNWPSPVPGDLFVAQTGAAAKNSLGYHYPMPGPPLTPMDATYHLTLLVPHGGDTFDLKFEASGLANMLDENWGVQAVQIEPVKSADIKTPDDDAIAQAFSVAIDPISTAQPEAVNTLIAGMDRTTVWIVQNVTPHGIDPGAAATAVADLGGDDTKIAKRDAANGTLFNFGPAVEPYLRDARSNAPGEVKARIDRILDRLGVTSIPDDAMRRIALATRVLEVIGTPAAIEERRHLVQGG